MLKRATKLTEIISAFPQAPLAGDEFEDYYVPVDKERDKSLSRVEELKQNLKKDNAKILFAGHRGSGKSTELNRLIIDIASTTFIVQFSVTQELDVNDLNYIDLVMVMMEQLADRAEEAKLIHKDSEEFERIKNWLSDVTEIKAEETGYMLEVEAGLKANRGILSSLIGLIAEFKAAIKSASSSKTEYRKKLEKKISLLKAHCNIMINEISLNLEKKGKKLLVIIEDLDKAETARTHEIFYRHSGILSELNASIVFTVSIFALMSPCLADVSGRFKHVSLPMLKTTEKGRGRFLKGFEVLREIVDRRAELSLFEDDVLDIMIERSGGVLRDLFEMIEIAANSASFQGLDVIDKNASDYAFERLKSKYRGMITIEDDPDTGTTTKSLYEKLQHVSRSTTKEFPLDERLLFLLSCLAVVEYNGEQWFDVHPAVKSLLENIDMEN